MSISVKEAVDILSQKLLINNYGVSGISHNSETIKLYVQSEEAAENLPDELLGFPVRKIVIGKLFTLSTLIQPSLKTGRTLEGLVGTKTDKWRPAGGGVSIGHKSITAGTLATRVFDKSSGKRLILSNNHVLANSNNAVIDDEILQPGPYDGGTITNDTIARLTRFTTIEQPPTENLIDAAVATPVSDNDLADEVLDIGILSDVEEASVGMPIEKSGRTSCHNEDTITDVNATVVVSGYNFDAVFKDQIMTGPMGQAGDSGSCVVDKSTKKAVGLLFAGSDVVTVLNKMTNVCNLLNITFTGGVKPKRSLIPIALAGLSLFGIGAVIMSSGGKKVEY